MSLTDLLRDEKKMDCGNNNKGSTIIKSILRSIEQSDALIEQFFQKYKEDEGDEIIVKKSFCTFSKGHQTKDDAVIISEIKCVNGELRNLITELMAHLDSKDKKLSLLKEKLLLMEENYTTLKGDIIYSDISTSSTSTIDSRAEEEDEV